VALGAISLLAAKTPECHGPKDKEHPCACMAKSNERANAMLAECLTRRQGQKDAAIRCAGEIPMHCAMVETYGNWSTNEAGEHDTPMPGQCGAACRKAKCRCDSDGPTCYFGGANRKEDR